MPELPVQPEGGGMTSPQVTWLMARVEFLEERLGEAMAELTIYLEAENVQRTKWRMSKRQSRGHSEDIPQDCLEKETSGVSSNGSCPPSPPSPLSLHSLSVTPVAPVTSLTPSPKKELFAVFEKSWQAYPKRNGKRLLKDKAETWFRNNVAESDGEAVLIAVINFAASDTAQRGFAKDMVRWLPDWQEWLVPETGRPSGNGYSGYDSQHPHRYTEEEFARDLPGF